jgi:hypothetical protein
MQCGMFIKLGGATAESSRQDGRQRNKAPPTPTSKISVIFFYHGRVAGPEGCCAVGVTSRGRESWCRGSVVGREGVRTWEGVTGKEVPGKCNVNMKGVGRGV